MGKARAISYSRIPINKCRWNDESKKSPLDKHHSSNCCRQESSKGLKLVDKSVRNRLFAQSQSYLATTHLLITKEKIVTLR